MYTYRVLNKNDKNVIDNGIIAKAPLDDSVLVKDALLQVSKHIQNGSGKSSAWISTSTSITKVLEHYGVPYNTGDIRTSVAVINNCIDTSEKVIISEPINNQKVVVNLSNNDELYKSMSNCLFCLTDGTFYIPIDVLKNYYSNIKELLNNTKIIATKGIKSTPGTKYARRSEEVIVLNKIDKENIVKVLNPLEIDILYAISKYNELNNIEFDIEDFINNKITNRDGVTPDNGIQYKIYYEMYIKYLFTCDIVKNLYEETDNDKSIDVLELYSYIKNIKRIIINKYLNRMGYNLDYIPLIDDYTHIIRVGNVNTNIIRNIDTNNYKFKLSNIGFNSEANIDSTIRKTLSYTYIYQNDGELFALGVSKGKDVITNDIDKKLELTKNKILNSSSIIE